MILATKDIEDLRETPEQKAERLSNTKELKCLESIEEAIYNLRKENKEYADKLNKNLKSIAEKINETNQKEQKQTDLSPILNAIQTLASGMDNRKDQTDILSMLTSTFASEINKVRKEFQSAIEKIQPKDNTSELKELCELLKQKKTFEIGDITRNQYSGMIDKAKFKVV